MLAYLDKLRTKPKEERARVAVLWAGGITLIIFIGWLIVLPFRFSESVSTPPLAEESGVSSLFSDFQSGWASVSSSAKNLTGSSTPLSDLLHGGAFTVKNDSASQGVGEGSGEATSSIPAEKDAF